MSSTNLPSNNLKQLNDMNFELSWRNISVWVKNKCNKQFWTLFEQEEYVKILNNVSGALCTGCLTAIIGASGSGKTTLLATISQRINGVLIGGIYLNNKSISRDRFKKISGFLPQQEIINNYLTVKEHMQLMARLKMKQNTSVQERNKTIYVVLNRLGLTDKAETQLLFLSGGELKKISLAEQLINDPPFLFCDEPTTGLDSFNAEIIIKILKNVAKSGKGVMCTIHQPTYGIFEIFDQVALLVKGAIVYHGPRDKFETYFNSLGLKRSIVYNPVEFYILYFGKNQTNAIFIQNMCDKFANSDYSIKFTNYLSNGIKFEESYQHLKTKTKLNFCEQFRWLLWKCFINMKRNNKNIILRFVLYMLIAVLLSLMFWDIAVKFNQKDIQNMEGLIFLVITETIFTFTYSVLHTFPDELPKILRDISDELYDSESYYLSKVVSLIPLIVFETMIYSGIIFWSTGLSGGFYGYIYFYFPVLCCALSSSAYGFALSTTFKSISAASLVSVPIEFLGMSFSGIYINITNLSSLKYYMPYISQFFYGTEAISIKQWENIDVLECENLDFPCVSNGHEVLERYGFHDDRYYLDLICLLLYFLLCHIIGFISFKKRCKKEACY